MDEEMGPIDLVVIGFPPGAPMTGDAVPLLMDLIDKGTIRVLDVMFVTKNEDGSVGGFDATDLTGQDVGDFRAFEGASSGLLGNDDMVTAAEALDPGSAAVLLVYENRWAAPFANAVLRNGGQLLATQRIPIEEVAAALDAAEQAA